MICKVSGKIIEKREDSIILDINNFCYEILIPGAVMSNLEKEIKQDNSISLITYHYHQIEPSRSFPFLIGFLNEIEKEFFEKFITVSGIGPKAAVRALNIPIPKIAQAIDIGDVVLLKSLPGIGQQRAKEIIAKLQGKIGKFGLIQDTSGESIPRATHKEGMVGEALEVLTQLQYKKLEAKDMIDKALNRNSDIKSVEDLLNEVYKQKSKK
ncbi:MAG: Holliday junction branch migration protein RuvA [Candidatus Omnitrophota bacterium]